MSFKDVIKTSIYESFGAGVNMRIRTICLMLLTACIAGAYIYFVYKNFSKSAFYSRDLNVTLAGITVVVAAIMVAMQSNLIVSMGMVGALSIVRFRTAIKNPLDLLYLFWAISEGIICGVGLYALGAVLCIIMTFALWALMLVPAGKAPMLLVVRAVKEASAEEIQEEIRKNSKYVRQISRTVKNGEQEIIYELNPKNENVIVDSLGGNEKIRSVNLLEHNGEMRG